MKILFSVGKTIHVQGISYFLQAGKSTSFKEKCRKCGWDDQYDDRSGPASDEFTRLPYGERCREQMETFECCRLGRAFQPGEARARS